MFTAVPADKAQKQLGRELKPKPAKGDLVAVQTQVSLGTLQDGRYPVLKGLDGSELGSAAQRHGVACDWPMSLSDTFIRRPVLSTVCSILILMAGLISLPLLPIENLPNIAPPTVQVSANLPGADAVTVESAVTGPLEEQINGAPGMDYITSNSTSEGSSQISVYFQANTNADIDQVNVLNRVQTATPQLPQQVSAQGITVQQTSSSILLVYNLTSTEGQYDASYLNGLYQLNLAYPLARAQGVGQVNVYGASNPAYRLWVDPEKLTRFNLSVVDVIDALEAQNQIVAAARSVVHQRRREPPPPSRSWSTEILRRFKSSRI